MARLSMNKSTRHNPRRTIPSFLPLSIFPAATRRALNEELTDAEVSGLASSGCRVVGQVRAGSGDLWLTLVWSRQYGAKGLGAGQEAGLPRRAGLVQSIGFLLSGLIL